MMQIHIAEIRKKFDLSQKELALTSGIPQSYLSRLERGYLLNPGILTFEDIANGFRFLGYDVEVSDLYTSYPRRVKKRRRIIHDSHV